VGNIFTTALALEKQCLDGVVNTNLDPFLLSCAPPKFELRLEAAR
jgi:hypothetical protein